MNKQLKMHKTALVYHNITCTKQYVHRTIIRIEQSNVHRQLAYIKAALMHQ